MRPEASLVAYLFLQGSKLGNNNTKGIPWGTQKGSLHALPTIFLRSGQEPKAIGGAAEDSTLVRHWLTDALGMAGVHRQEARG